MSARLFEDVALRDVPLTRPTGRLVGVTGMLLRASGCALPTGARCRVQQAGGTWLEAEVVGFGADATFLMPFKRPVGLVAGADVQPVNRRKRPRIGPQWLGRMINGLGEPIDGAGPLGGVHLLAAHPPTVDPLRKRPVREVLDVGVRAINGPLTLGRGQRVGLMAGSGVGKSVLLGMISRGTDADVVVVGLIGERGREVGEFVDEALGAAGRAKSVLIVAPADESPLMRVRATELAHVVAAHYRDHGQHVLLLVDSLTRYAMARREIALALGEPPATKGYPPSVFGGLPELVESAGNGTGAGSMSAIYTVLAEGDDQNDPVVDTARAILDGHIVLARTLAERGHFPAIDVARSVSRCASQICERAHLQRVRTLRAHMERYEAIRELIPLGGYVAGADPLTDQAVKLAPAIDAFLKQEIDECTRFDETAQRLRALLA
ncbi:FliI/YscN family ATPase [Chitinasiproducens palmae]|uniref:Flagellum-specific ATP synthase n=1 Tax=Chitinasiproducens palmae TaxID=1770053 RepID=A0A1H2PMH5_9BURK|nr:FliI/YscN family ATPase [Chitinasiproducens palmae]SDV46936.1 flagellum-specific ATP synthase [Chitinasiproducens palmae]